MCATSAISRAGKFSRRSSGGIIGADGRSGVEFYGFPLITDVEQFKQRFREALDRSADSALSDRIIEETKTAFVRHEVLFREIEQD